MSYYYEELDRPVRHKLVTCFLGFFAGLLATFAISSTISAHSTQWITGNLKRGFVPIPSHQAGLDRKLELKGKGTFNVEVDLEDEEEMEYGVRDFMTLVSQGNIIAEYRRRRRYENSHYRKFRKDREKGAQKLLGAPLKTMEEFLKQEQVTNLRSGLPIEEI
eukprot:GGOE01053556.1.p1 GENE.GGOE01053556.1~~GGOE01053556.1.p1  ORF type:complete len:162 (-),score=13.28 GGOE01053556.1:249-734(-)